jgi:hypothetical protein
MLKLRHLGLSTEAKDPHYFPNFKKNFHNGLDFVINVQINKCHFAHKPHHTNIQL